MAMTAFNTYYQKILTSRMDVKTKMRIFEAYITSVFIHVQYSELWTVNKQLEQKLTDVFQRRLLKKILRIKWPFTISNKELYERTKREKWSVKIMKRRLKWLGHLIRLPEETSAKKAKRESLRPVKRPRGRPKDTWMSLVNKQRDLVGELTNGGSVTEEEVFSSVVV